MYAHLGQVLKAEQLVSHSSFLSSHAWTGTVVVVVSQFHMCGQGVSEGKAQ